jgi:L-fuconolactonase
MKLADAHAHFFSQGYQSAYGTLFPDNREIAVYQTFREVHQIDSVLAIGYAESPYQNNNRELSRLAAIHSWIHPLAYCAIQRPAKLAALKTYSKHRFAGISLYVNRRSEAARLNQWPEYLVRFLNQWRAIISLNISLTDLATVQPFLKRLPECPVLISHLGLPWSPNHKSNHRTWTAIARLSNVGVKASGFYSGNEPYPHPGNQKAFAILLDAFSSRRLYWGSDFSPALEFVSFVQTLDILNSLNLKAPDRSLVAGQNLRHLLNSRSKVTS